MGENLVHAAEDGIESLVIHPKEVPRGKGPQQNKADTVTQRSVIAHINEQEIGLWKLRCGMISSHQDAKAAVIYTFGDLGPSDFQENVFAHPECVWHRTILMI